MARKRQSSVGAKVRPLIGGKEYTPPPELPNLAAKFMRENRGGLPDEDTPAMTLAGDLVDAAAKPAPVATAETPPPAEPIVPDAGAPPPSDAPPVLDPAAQAALDAAAPPKPPADAAGGSADVPPVVSAAETPAQPVAAAPPRNEYDPEEEISLLEGEPKWKRASVVLGLQERANLQQEVEALKPVVAERDQLIKTFGASDTKTALGIIEPFVRAIRENPARGALLDAVAAMDPATLNYVGQLLEDWKQLPVDQRAAFGQVGPATQPQAPTDPRYDKLAQNQTLLEESLLKSRAEREVTGILGDWPFLRQDRKAWEAIQSAATAMWNEDESKGVPPLQRRGYVEAIAQNRHFLEIMKAAQERRVMQHATAATQPPSQLGQPPAPSAILPATHPQPPVAARPPQNKQYRGPVDGAAAAFLADQGYTK